MRIYYCTYKSYILINGNIIISLVIKVKYKSASNQRQKKRVSSCSSARKNLMTHIRDYKAFLKYEKKNFVIIFLHKLQMTYG